jgi:hypothetical protein
LTALRRLLVLGLIAALSCACRSEVDPAPPSTVAAPLDTQTASAPTALPSLTPDCAALERNGGPGLEIELNTPNGYRTLFTQEVAARSGSGRAIAVPNALPPGVQDFGELEGGINLPGVVTQDQDPIQVRDVSVSGVFTVAGQPAPLPLQISLAGSSIALAFPDIDATVTFGVDLYYRDNCFVYEAAARGTALLGSGATVAKCPVGDALLPYVVSLAKGPISVSGTPTRFEINSYQPRWSIGSSSTDGPPLVGWDRAAAPITTDRDARLRIVSGNEELTIDSVSVAIYRRADVLRDQVNAEPISDFHVPATADGRLEIHPPTAPGRYVVLLSWAWSAACATGGAFSILAMNVE